MLAAGERRRVVHAAVVRGGQARTLWSVMCTYRMNEIFLCVVVSMLDPQDWFLSLPTRENKRWVDPLYDHECVLGMAQRSAQWTPDVKSLQRQKSDRLVSEEKKK